MLDQNDRSALVNRKALNIMSLDGIVHQMLAKAHMGKYEFNL